MRQPRFANARSVRNELERARLRHAHRLASDPDLSWSKDDLMRIEPADILSSPVFSLAASLSAMEESARRLSRASRLAAPTVSPRRAPRCPLRSGRRWGWSLDRVGLILVR